MKAGTKKVPQLRFPGFVGEWEEIRLGALCSTFRSGSGITAEDISETGPFPVFGGNGLRGFTGTFTHDGEYFLIGRQGALCGNINYLDGKAFISEHAIAVAGNETTDTKWLGLRLDHHNLNRLSESSAQPGLSVGKLTRLKFRIPTLPEQQKIAAFLTAVDGRIGQLSEKKALLEAYKKGAMEQLFSRELRFRDDDGNEFPEWEERRLGELGGFKNGLNKDKLDFGFGSPFVNLIDVFGKRILNQADFGLVNASKKELLSYNLRLGDVLFIRSSVKRSGVGEAIVVAEDIEGAVYSGFLIRFRPKGDKLKSGFMMYCFAAPEFRKELLSFATTSANTNINQESLAQVRITIPSLPEQTKIAAFLTALDRKIEAVSAQIDLTRTFKKGLLQQMFV